MYSQSTAHFPADSIPRRDGAPDGSEHPVVLVAFARLVLMFGALSVFGPLWLDLIGDLAKAPPPQDWTSFRLVAVGGAAALLAVALTFLRVWIGLLKHLARAD